MNKLNSWEEEFDELVRDITKVGWMAKSEARSKLEQIVLSLLQTQREELMQKIEGLKYEQPLLGTPETAERIMFAVNSTLDQVLTLLKE